MTHEQTPEICFIQGASRGIGLGLVEDCLDRGAKLVFASCRNPERADDLARLQTEVGDRLRLVTLDVTDEASIAAAAEETKAATDRLELMFNVAGLLHDGELGPEKSLRDLDPQHLQRVFAVNAIGPVLMAKHFHQLFRHDRRAVWANMSARVGSIGDNFLGGWYGYRASKAALNQFTRTYAVEMGRKAPETIVVALHPGTVETDLSAPFRGSVPEHKLFSIPRATRQLLDVIDGLSTDDSGQFFAWDGEPIPW